MLNRGYTASAIDLIGGGTSSRIASIRYPGLCITKLCQTAHGEKFGHLRGTAAGLGRVGGQVRLKYGGDDVFIRFRDASGQWGAEKDLVTLTPV